MWLKYPLCFAVSFLVLLNEFLRFPARFSTTPPSIYQFLRRRMKYILQNEIIRNKFSKILVFCLLCVEWADGRPGQWPRQEQLWCPTLGQSRHTGTLGASGGGRTNKSHIYISTYLTYLTVTLSVSSTLTLSTQVAPSPPTLSLSGTPMQVQVHLLELVSKSPKNEGS